MVISSHFHLISGGKIEILIYGVLDLRWGYKIFQDEPETKTWLPWLNHSHKLNKWCIIWVGLTERAGSFPRYDWRGFKLRGSFSHQHKNAAYCLIVHPSLPIWLSINAETQNRYQHIFTFCNSVVHETNPLCYNGTGVKLISRMWFCVLLA